MADPQFILSPFLLFFFLLFTFCWFQRGPVTAVLQTHGKQKNTRVSMNRFSDSPLP
ncbi:hypothetical protein MYCTH_2300166 [Thermothelomyces thermophilus ATCC 42464]|uniref:ATP synthase F0 subunit 8 n=1 Tax=Thermothelomyces thermophilus (strain ATCC 42464 / BCRC 31852 / DSM 1799) TaxID=573729 RepID=G2QAI3_THET4|nr:uncharacterized protein MYCTH_2300166 [Thermothelomyces thermophilus ATCC 42464]AEO55879.1 hypothetical protein MYCTH_2300166 [Thermothelomyces thermophilus ATCC 42464]